LNFGAKNPPHRQAVNRWWQFYLDTSLIQKLIMTKYFKSFFILVTLLCIEGNLLYGQNFKKYSKEIENKIEQVENNVIAETQIESLPPIKWTLKERMKFYHTNGVSITVIKDYKIQWTKTYGWADSIEQRSVTSVTMFQAGSNSKSLNAMGVLKLVQEGKINLKDDINKYLKSWKFPYDTLSKGKNITVANLLSHTAGISVHGFPGYEIGDSLPTLRQILDGQQPANTKAVRSIFEPALKFKYSGGGTTILQMIIEDVTGQKYEEYMWQNVLKPLNMTNSSYNQPPTMKKSLATGYYNNGKTINGNYHIYPEKAAAGLWTTSNDLAKYVIETQLSLKGKSQKILNSEMTKLRLTPLIDNNSTAFGVFIINKKGIKYFNHGGVNEGFVSQYVGSFEGGNGAVVMTNTYNISLCEEIIYGIASAYNWKNYIPEIRKEKIITIPNKLIDTYIGKYKLGNDLYAIVRMDSGVYLQDLAEMTLWKMYFTDTKNFIVLEDGMILSFVTDNMNKVIGLKMDNEIANKME
jgi:CubicO group peptidase (beta-lactamase class C family)